MQHIGAGATAAALRDRLRADGVVTTSEFDTAFAGARLTPGTNLIALFAALGYRIAGVRGAVGAVTAGMLPAASISVLVCAAYLQIGGSPATTRAIGGASAGALAVLVWAALKFLWPILRGHAVATPALVAGTIALQLLGVPAGVAILVAAASGAVLLREPRP